LQVAAAGNLSIVDVNSPNANPGEAVDVVFTVENTGEDTIAEIEVTSTVLTSNGYTVPVPDITGITNLLNGTLEKTFTITLPSIPAGTYSGEITVEDRQMQRTQTQLSILLQLIHMTILSLASAH